MDREVPREGLQGRVLHLFHKHGVLISPYYFTTVQVKMLLTLSQFTSLKTDDAKHLCNSSVSENLEVLFVRDCLGIFLSPDKVMNNLLSKLPFLRVTVGTRNHQARIIDINRDGQEQMGNVVTLD